MLFTIRKLADSRDGDRSADHSRNGAGAVPTLAHGELPPDPDALRVPLRHNFVPIPIEGFGSAPSLGVYAAVVTGGRLSPGDEVRLGG